MEMVKLIGVIGMAVAVGAALYAARCRLGLHPREGRRMCAGSRRRDSVHLVARWECGRCNQPVGVTDLTVSTQTMMKLRRQVPGARARSRVVNLVAVAKAEKSA